MKELIGFIHKSINFDNLKSYFVFAERDMRKIIGQDVLKVADDHYNSDNFLLATPDDDHPEYAILDQLVSRIQYPMAVHAYRRYVPSSDIAHSEKGRQIFVSDNDKPAFEWQIEKDNENLLALAHEATDVLIEFLDENIDVKVGLTDELLIPWDTSPAYKETKELFIPCVDEFEKVYLIGGSRATFLTLAPFMRRVQDNEICAVLGVDRYLEILEQYTDGDLSDGNKLILDKVRPPLALLTLSIASKRLSAQILPSGIFTNVVTNVIKSKSPASKQDRNEISSNLEKDGLREMAKLQEYLRKIDVAVSGATIDYSFPEAIDPSQKFIRL